MFFDKNEAAKRQIEKAYYQGLKQQIQMKNSKIADKDKRHAYDYQLAQKQQFSLIKNIQTQEQIRKNKKSQYYSQLRKQLQDQKNKKQKMKQEQKRLEKLQEEKINRENQILRQRYEQQIKKEKKGSNNNIKEDNSNNNNNAVQNNNQNENYKNVRKMTNHLQPIQQSQQNKKHFYNKNQDFKRLKTSDSQQEDYQPQNSLQLQSMNYGDRSRQNSLIQLNHIPTYANRIQNQPFNYIPKKRHMDSYFKQLLVQRREFQHQASGISELNKLFHQQRYRPQKIQSRGLQELKNLQSILQQKSSQYMSNLNSRTSRPYQISQNSMFKAKQSKFYQPKDQWRRLD